MGVKTSLLEVVSGLFTLLRLSRRRKIISVAPFKLLLYFLSTSGFYLIMQEKQFRAMLFTGFHLNAFKVRG